MIQSSRVASCSIRGGGGGGAFGCIQPCEGDLSPGIVVYIIIDVNSLHSFTCADRHDDEIVSQSTSTPELSHLESQGKLGWLHSSIYFFVFLLENLKVISLYLLTAI